MVLLVLRLRHALDVDFDSVHVLDMLKKPPRGVDARFARRANVVAGFCWQRKKNINLLNKLKHVKTETQPDRRFTAILTRAKCLVIALTYRSVGPRVGAWCAF